MIELWGEAVRSIEPQVKPAQRNLWLRPIECLSIGQGHVRLRAPNRYHKEWFEDHFLPSILEDLEARAQQKFVVEFEIADETTPVSPASDVAVADGEGGFLTPAEVPRPQPRTDLLSRYTFDRFVVGPTNRFAFSAAQMVADNPASKWNPLFIYGGVGVGKTHLLQAVGHEVARQHPDWNIVFISCEKFVTDFIGSLAHRGGGAHQMEGFRKRYRQEPDCLLIDDIQFLSNKDSSQDEFFHTFNALHYAHKQIILTCDKLPGEVAGLEDRLRSRFTWGLIAEIETPDLETRVAILKRKAEADGVDLPDEVALHVASAVKTNVRDLEGALARLAARSSFDKVPITMELVRDALKNLLAASATGLSVDTIQRDVSAYFGVKLADLKGPKRHRAIAQPRMIAMYLTRKLTNMSFPEIGSRFGGKDHSTVISAVRKIDRLCNEDQGIRSIVGTLESHLKDH